MNNHQGSKASWARRWVAVSLGVILAGRGSLAQVDPRPGPPSCTVDLTNSGSMKDVVWNALSLGLGVKDREVAAFMVAAETRYQSGQALLEDAARNFRIEVPKLQAEVERFRHCNCTHEGGGSPVGDKGTPSSALAELEASATLSKFAADVILHVVLHEIGHGLIREFDLPVLANEETMADAFATHYLTHHLPDRAPDVLLARVRSWMIESAEVPRADWPVTGEHSSDARRAYEVAALAVAADPERYAAVAQAAGLSEREILKATDYGAEIHRAWRRVLTPLWMPVGTPSREAAVTFDQGSSLLRQLQPQGTLTEIESALRRFDWHSRVKVHFASGEGGAAWSRSSRTITVRSGYLLRFITQGLIAPKPEATSHK